MARYRSSTIPMLRSDTTTSERNTIAAGGSPRETAPSGATSVFISTASVAPINVNIGDVDGSGIQLSLTAGGQSHLYANIAPGTQLNLHNAHGATAGIVKLVWMYD